MTTIRFEEVRTRAAKVMPCTSCGKKVRRSRTFTQTINPFNRNTDGQVKDYAEVRAAVVAEADTWRVDPDVVCAACNP